MHKLECTVTCITETSIGVYSIRYKLEIKASAEVWWNRRSCRQSLGCGDSSCISIRISNEQSWKKSTITDAEMHRSTASFWKKDGEY